VIAAGGGPGRRQADFIVTHEVLRNSLRITAQRDSAAATVP